MVFKFIELKYHGKMNSSTIKKFQNFSEYIFSKNSSFTANSSFKKVVDPYIFLKQ